MTVSTGVGRFIRDTIYLIGLDKESFWGPAYSSGTLKVNNAVLVTGPIRSADRFGAL